MKKEDKITAKEYLMENQKRFWRTEKDDPESTFFTFKSVVSMLEEYASQLPVQEQSKQEVTEDEIKKHIDNSDYGRYDSEECPIYYTDEVVKLVQHFLSLPQEQKDKVTGVSESNYGYLMILNDKKVFVIGKNLADAISVLEENCSTDDRWEFETHKSIDILRSLSSKAVEQKEPDEWVEYDFRKLHTRPNKYGKYFVCRKDGKTHWETWNGSGWAYNENSIKYWKEILPPNKSSNHGLNKEPNGWVSDGCFYPNDGTHIANELATPVYFHPPIQEAEHKQGVTDLEKFVSWLGQHRAEFYSRCGYAIIDNKRTEGISPKDLVELFLRSLFGEKGKEGKDERI